MDAYKFTISIPYNDFVLGVLLLIFAITTFLAISNHRKKFKHFANPLQLLADNYLWIVLPLGTLAIGFAVYEWIWQILPKVGQIITKLKPADETPENIRNLAYAIGALLAAVALSATIPFQLIKVWVNERLAKTTEQGHMTDRISKAVEQLGAEKTVKDDIGETSKPNLEVRLGAIYALERIAQDSLRDHIPVMEILCAYVRNNAPADKAHTLTVDYQSNDWKQTQRAEIKNIPEPKIDIQAILTVIGRRKAKHIAFERDATANPIKRAYQLDLRHTNLQKLDLTKLKLNHVLLTDSKLQGAYLRWAKLQGAHLTGAELQGAYLRWAKLQGAYLTGAELQGAHLTGAELQGAHLTGAELQGAHLRWAKLQGADLGWAELQGADLGRAELQGAHLTGAELQGAYLRWAKVDKDTNFTDASLLLASVKLVNLKPCLSLSNKQAKSMFGDASTSLPDQIKKPDWAAWHPDEQEYRKKWQAAKAAANL